MLLSCSPGGCASVPPVLVVDTTEVLITRCRRRRLVREMLMFQERPATVVLPNLGDLIDVVGDRYRFLATRESTAGTYAIWEATVPPGGGPPPHLHTREEEGF